MIVAGLLWALCCALLWIVISGAALAYTTCGALSIALRSLEVALLFPVLIVAIALVRAAVLLFMGKAAQAAEVIGSWGEEYAAWYRRGPQVTCLLTILLPLALWSMLGRYEVHHAQIKRGKAVTERVTLVDRLTGHSTPLRAGECTAAES